MSADDMDANVQTPERAPEPDLFGHAPAPAGPRPDCTIAYTGRIARVPHLATRLDGRGRTVSVIVIDLEEVGVGRHQVTVHVPFTDSSREQAERQARALHRGQTVTVLTALSDVRLFLPAATFVTDQHH